MNKHYSPITDNKQCNRFPAEGWEGLKGAVEM